MRSVHAGEVRDQASERTLVNDVQPGVKVNLLLDTPLSAEGVIPELVLERLLAISLTSGVAILMMGRGQRNG